MAAIVTNKSRIYAAQKFIEGLGTTPPRSDNNVYLFIAKTLPWTTNDGAGASDNTPPFPKDTVAGHIKVWANMVHLKRVSAANANLVIRRFDWTLNTVYTQYDQDVDLFDPTLGVQPFYVLTDDLNVYKCIFNNNGGPSFVKPTGTSTNVIATGDRYLWKYMFTVGISDAQKFLTNEWIPVKTLVTSDGSRQWDVQQSAIPGSIEVLQIQQQGQGYVTPPNVYITGDGSGATAIAKIKNGKVVAIQMIDKGKDYTFASATVDTGQITQINVTVPGSGYVGAPTVTITGDGSGATASAVVSNGSVVAINILTPGINYTTATVNIALGSGQQAQATAVISGGVQLKAIISPPGGHGSDPISELGAFFAMMTAQLQFDENGKFSVANDFRTLGLILNPLKWNSEEIQSGTTITAAYQLHVPIVTGTFNPDDLVKGSVSNATAVVLDYNATTGMLRIVNVIGTFLAGENVATLDTLNSGLIEEVNGLAQGGTNTSITLASSDTAATDAYKGFTIRTTSGHGAGQQRIITGNSNATKESDIDKPWDINPNNTTHYSIANIAYPDVQPNTGYIMYIENRRPIQRATDQLESFKPVMEF